MLSNNTKSRKRASAVSVKFTLIPLVVPLLLAGMLAVAVGKERPATLIPADSKFLNSLRFWEKKPSPNPQPTGNAETHRIPVERRENTAPQRSATPGAAPEPPPIPLVESRPVTGHASMSPRSTNFPQHVDETETSPSQGALPRTASHISYSFDARDWVEFFPQQQEAQQHEVRERAVATMQATSLHSPIPSSPTPQSPVLHDISHNSNNGISNGDQDQWDGDAMRLATIASIRDEINKLQREPNQIAASPQITASPQIVASPQIDLTPSYQRLLPYVQTCGVVVVQANFPLTEIVSILDEIHMLQNDLTRYIGVPAATEKIELCLFNDEKSYKAFLKEYFSKAPDDRRALYIKLDKNPGTLLVQKTKDFEVDLRHEMTHAIVHASIPQIPIWLDEGLAKYFEVPPQDRANNHPYMANVRFNSKLGNIPSLDRLAKLKTIDDMGVKEYRDSWAWTHFLIHRSPETHRLLAGYLQMLATWSPKDVKAGGIDQTSPPSLGAFYMAQWSGVVKESIPSLKLYLDDIMPNQRESFREHFGAKER